MRGWRERLFHTLRSTVEANEVSTRRMAEERQKIQDLFDSVSDCVFVFEGERLEQMNAEGRRLLTCLGERKEEVLVALRRTIECDPGEFPIRLQFGNDRSDAFFLSINSVAVLPLAKSKDFLVTVEDLTREEMLREECRTIVADERRRIGRNLHDGAAQVLTSLVLQSKAMAMSEINQSVKKELEEIASLAQKCLESGAEITNRLESAGGSQGRTH